MNYQNVYNVDAALHTTKKLSKTGGGAVVATTQTKNFIQTLYNKAQTVEHHEGKHKNCAHPKAKNSSGDGIIMQTLRLNFLRKYFPCHYANLISNDRKQPNGATKNNKNMKIRTLMPGGVLSIHRSSFVEQPHAMSASPFWNRSPHFQPRSQLFPWTIWRDYKTSENLGENTFSHSMEIRIFPPLTSNWRVCERSISDGKYQINEIAVFEQQIFWGEVNTNE